MDRSTDQQHLLHQQYHNGTRLSARAYLHGRFRTNQQSWFDWLFPHLLSHDHHSVLELGCGPGWLWLVNQQRIPTAWDITLSDFSAGMLAEAQRNLEQQAHPFHFAVIDAQAIPYPDGQFDTVIANHMLYHVPDLPNALGEIRRVLSSSGRFYASTVGVHHLQELFTLFPAASSRSFQRFSFTVQNGQEQIEAFFEHVTLHRYEDELVVTEAEPLLAYMQSMSSKLSEIDQEQRAKILSYVQQHIDADGAIRLTSEVGLFEAW